MSPAIAEVAKADKRDRDKRVFFMMISKSFLREIISIYSIDNGNYYQDADGKYYPLTSLVEKDGKYQKTNYSTSRYAVYYLGE